MEFSIKGGIYYQQFLFSNRLDYDIRKESLIIFVTDIYVTLKYCQTGGIYIKKI
jgi:hypothetical protein